MRDNTIDPIAMLRALSMALSNVSESNSGIVEESTTDVEYELEPVLEEIAVILELEELTLEEAIIKQNLDELLLVLLILHEESHGDELLTEIADSFDVRLSPGTLYPRLHDLEEQGVLSMHTKVRTKEYSIVDQDVVRDRLEATMVQHLAFGMLLYAGLERF